MPRSAESVDPEASTADSDFAELLKTWRHQRGLSQLQLGSAAAVSPRHMSFLESGRARPSRPMVLRLAEALQIDLIRRNELLAAAGFRPVYSALDLDSPELAELRATLRRTLRRHEPFPAMVLDPSLHLVAANGGAQVLLAHVQPEALRPPVNVLALCLRPDGLRSQIENLSRWSGRVRDTVLSERADAALRQVLTEWPPPADDAVDAGAGFHRDSLRLRLDGVSLMFHSAVSFVTADTTITGALRVESLYPSDQATADYMRAAVNP